ALSVSNTPATFIQGNTISGIDHTTNFVGNFGGAAGFSAIDAGLPPFQGGLFNIPDNVIGCLDGSSSIVVHPPATFASWAVMGIHRSNAPNYIISGNHIGAVSIAENTTANIGFFGIYVDSSAPVTISNNVIGGPDPAGAIRDNAIGSVGSYEVDGILALGCDG